MLEQVAGQTSSELKYADVFKRESEGMTTDTEAAKASAVEFAGDVAGGGSDDADTIVSHEHAREEEVAADRERIGTTRAGQPIESIKQD